MSDIVEAASLIKKDLGLDPSELSGLKASYASLKQMLVPILNYLLDNDMPRLLHALYRIDVDEEGLKRVLSAHAPGKIAEALADLIIKRQLKKIEIRKKYSS